MVTNRNQRVREVYSHFDIQVQGKFGVVRIAANPNGRQIVEDWCPDVDWWKNDAVTRVLSPEWVFTQVRVTRLPPDFETPLAFAGPDALGFAVACTLYRRAWPRRVAYCTGWGDDLRLNVFGSRPYEPKGADLALFAEYSPPDPYAMPGERPDILS